MEAECLCSTVINNLPAPIIETILSLLPFKEAARTGVLSREWKYHWTKLSRLEFVTNAVKVSTYDDDVKQWINEANLKLFYAINQAMSISKGPIHEFCLSTYAVHGPCVEIDHIIDNLSRNNAVKKLKLDIPRYRLPESLFSLHKLTDLYLDRCHLDVQPTFNAFDSLANLYMENVIITTKMLLIFLSRCPLLKTVILNPDFERMPAIDDDSTVIELFESLLVVENLTINLPALKYFAQGRVPNKLPAALVHLKYLCIRDTYPSFQYRIPCYAFLIRSSPNLEKLKLVLFFSLSFGLYEGENYSDMWLEHLNELEIELWNNKSYRLDFVELILTKSPVLNKLKVLLPYKVTKAEELKLQISGSLLQSPRASPMVEVIVERGAKPDRRPFNQGL